MTRYILLATFCFCICSQLMGEPQGGYSFTVNGEEWHALVQTTDSEHPTPGNVVSVRGYYLCLDEPGAYVFEDGEDNVLRRVMPDGRKSVIACKVALADKTYGAPIKVVNPLATMSDRELKNLRGVRLERWPEGMDALLAKLDLARVVLDIDSEALGDEEVKLRSFPDETAYLFLESGNACSDFSSLSALKKLQYLSFRIGSSTDFDFRVLAGLPLEFLELPWGFGGEQVKHFEAVTTLKRLKRLNANTCGCLGDGAFLSQLPELRQFYAKDAMGNGEEAPEALDLSGLSVLPKLFAFRVDNSPVKRLPKTKLPSLKQASIMITNAPSEEIDAFVKANPEADIKWSMNAELATVLKGATRLQVRTGGPYRREDKRSKTIHDTTDKEVIQKIASHMLVEESNSGGHCMCAGDPTFKFYAGNEILAMISFHHGQSIRWSGDCWPGDGVLESVSSGFLADWLAEHGYSRPKEQLQEARQRGLAAQRRSDRYNALLPKAVNEKLSAAESMEQATEAFTKNIPDEAERAVLFLRLYGSDFGSWSLTNGLDQALVETWLPSVPEKTMREVIPKIIPKSEEGLGAMRWLFGLGHATDWREQWSSIESLARFALTHPRQENRRRALVILSEIRGQALPLLRETMTTSHKIQELPKDEVFEAGGMKTFYPNAITLPEAASDQVTAALCLAAIEDEPSKLGVDKMRAGLSSEIADAWDEHLKTYREHQKQKAQKE